MTINRREFFKTLGAVAGGAAALAAGVRTTVAEAREYNRQVQTFADALPVPLAEDLTDMWVELDGVRYAVDSYAVTEYFKETPAADFGNYESCHFWPPKQKYWSVEFTTRDAVHIAKRGDVSDEPIPFVAGGWKSSNICRGLVYVSGFPLRAESGSNIYLVGTGPLIVEPA